MKHILIGKLASQEVWLDGRKLSPNASQKIHNHSPDGFSWGYGGSGPAQLALAIMLRLCPTVQMARNKYQEFKWNVIAKLPQTDFETNFYFEV